MIKPHAIQEKNVGKIIDMILSAGFEISALELFNLDKPTATEFLEVYRVKLRIALTGLFGFVLVWR